MSETPRKLKDLRVSDLKVELEKRGLAVSGVKAVLVDRLKSQLIEEGINVDEHVFYSGKGRTSSVSEDSNQAPSDKGESEKDEPGHDTASEEEESDQNSKQDIVQAVEQPEEEKSSKTHQVPKENDDAKEDESNCKEDEKVELKPAVEEVGGDELEQEIVTQNKEDKPKQNMDGEAGEKEGEDDSLNIMIGDEDNLFADEERQNGVPASPPRPETVPAKHPFTSKDTINLSSRSEKPPSENSSMRVNPDETMSVPSPENADGKMETSSQESLQPAEEEDPDKNEKEEKPVPKTSRNLWIRGLSSTTKATELKELFAQHGQVLGAKIVTHSRNPKSRCFGYVTMESPEDADKCIEVLNKTQLHGNVIMVDKVTAESSPRRSDTHRASSSKPRERRRSSTRESGRSRVDQSHTSSRSQSRSHHHHSGGRSDTGVLARNHVRGQGYHRGGHGGNYRHEGSYQDNRREMRRPSPPFNPHAARLPTLSHHQMHSSRREEPRHNSVLTFNQIRDQRRKEIERDEERRRRERERRKEEEDDKRRRETLRRQKEEEDRLRRERDAIRKEREKLEREKQELMKFERERQRMEREKLEREKLELERLRRQQVIGGRRDDERRGTKRVAEDRAPFFDDRKRPMRDNFSSGSRGISNSDFGSNYSPYGESSRRMDPAPMLGSRFDSHGARDIVSSRGGLLDDRGMGSSSIIGGGGHHRDSGSSRDMRSSAGGPRDGGRSSGSNNYRGSRDDRGPRSGGAVMSSHGGHGGGARNVSMGSSHGSSSGWGGQSSRSGSDWRSGGMGGDRSSRSGISGSMSSSRSMDMLMSMPMSGPSMSQGMSQDFGNVGSSGLGSSSSSGDRYDAYSLKSNILGHRRF